MDNIDILFLFLGVFLFFWFFGGGGKGGKWGVGVISHFE